MKLEYTEIAKALLAASNANIGMYTVLERLAVKIDSKDPELRKALDEVQKRINAQIDSVGGVING